jgi:hypothetical protein
MKVQRKSLSEFSDKDKNELDIFIEQHGGLVFHEFYFNKIASDVFKTCCFYYIAFIRNEIVGICPVHVIRHGVLKLLFSNMSSHEIPYGGWVFNEIKTSIFSLINSAKIHFNESLFYSSNIQPANNSYELIKISSIKKLNTVILNLSTSIDDLFNKVFPSKHRNKIKRAQKLGVTVEIIPFAKFDEFISLSEELNKKANLSGGLPEFYKRIMDYYNSKNKIVCLASKFKNQFISSMILIANKNFTIAWVAGRKVELPNNLYQNELLWWESIVWAKKFGSKYLDLCGLDEIELPHLARIKLSFSKEIVPFYFFTKKTFLFRIINKVQNVFFL